MMDPQTMDTSAPVTYVRSPRAKRLRITISPDSAVRVTLPPRMSLQEARRFVSAKRDWIDKHLLRMARQQARQQQTPPPNLSPEDLIAAQNRLFDRLEQLSRRHNLTYRRAAFRCQKSKWGSCSAQNNISLNINMVFLPEHLQEYLLLHELTHIVHKHHGPAFWSHLDRLCGGAAKKLAKELKSHPFHLK